MRGILNQVEYMAKGIRNIQKIQWWTTQTEVEPESETINSHFVVSMPADYFKNCSYKNNDIFQTSTEVILFSLAF